MFYAGVLTATAGLLAATSSALPLFGDHSVIEYCTGVLDCHFERVRENQCLKLSHPGNVQWIGGSDDCWLYGDDECNGDGKYSLDILPTSFDPPFNGMAVYCP
ncbi:hypothetical protein N7510_001641 [Penicillium lagena]|uniref:uncharacterized protein n=1 Tax=Penicillium lagena TaxID=94218 RepID=UPI0025423D2F|nr:uncharacterized protein N7510_001641 [Penicillium lagena]KAJ5625332.1 hypothetical protein N7510_001641 [Penicillium lagena]